MLVAAYLSVRFGEKDRMKVFSLFFAISAIGSLLFVAAYPEEGIHRATTVTFCWRLISEQERFGSSYDYCDLG